MAIVKFYRGDPNAPKTTQKTHLGANVLIVHKDRLLLEKRRDSDTWGMIGGGVKKTENAIDAIVREVWEETGLKISAEKFQKLGIYDEPKRVAAYHDGSIWKMVVVAYVLNLEDEPNITVSSESKELRFFTREELKEIDIVVTHSDIVEEGFINKR